MAVVSGYEDVGLSYEERSSGFLLRWRQNETQPDGSTKRVRLGHMTFSREERRKMEDVIGQALRTVGYWRAPDMHSGPALPLLVNMEHAARDWIAWKVGTRGVAPATRANLARSMKRFFTAVRSLRGLKSTDPVPPSAMTTTTINDVTASWRSKYAEGTVYQTVAAVVDMWSWVADDPAKYPEVPRPPYNLDRVMPVQPSYEAPEAEPTWDETDACVRRVRLPFPRRLATIMRYTGLRLEQVVSIHREDFDLAHATLLIRKGKSRREHALMRRVPVSRHLLDDLGGWVAGQPAGPLFPDSKDPSVPMKSYRNQTRYITEAWQSATDDGEVRLEVWAPPNRLKARPDHAFRAALQGALQEVGLSDAVVDFLVGHAPKSTRGRHYAKPSPNALREAVDAIPPIAWGETAANVIFLSRRARA